jgi:SNF2 family DNA or RNA helicase
VKKTFGLLDFEDEQWVLKKLNPHVTIRFKALFPKISITDRPPFLLPDTLDVAADLEWFNERYPLEMDYKIFNRLKIKTKIHEQRIVNLEKIMDEDYEAPKVLLCENAELRQYQSKAVEIILKNRFLFLGDDLGLGKTVTGIGVLVSEGTIPSFIVVPSHLMEHWLEKISEFTNLRVHKIKGTQPYKLPQADVFIIKYSCLPGWIDMFCTMKYKSVIFDEVHYLRRSESQRYIAASELVKYSDIKLGLSATPIFNYGEEIFNILDILNKDGLGSKESFLREWTDFNKVVKDPMALGSFLRDNFMFLRRRTEDVGIELPQVNKIVQNVDFDQKTVKNAESLMKQLAQKVLSGSFTEQGQAARELDIFARKITGIAKARAVAEYVKILLDNNRPVLLVGWHRDVYEIWKEAFKEHNPVFYTGAETSVQKNENAKQFMKDEETNLMIISLASGEGLDGLQFKSADIVFGELAWSPAVHEQLIGRLNRKGQEQQVTAHFLVSDSGSDPLIIELLGLKASQSRRIVDPTVVVEEVSHDASRMKLLAQHLLDKKE